MKKTILTCDRCKKEVEELHDVGAGKREYHNSLYGEGSFYEVRQLCAEWCLNCCIEMGITKVRETDIKEKDPIPTLEDLIREIVREELEGK